MKVKKDYERIKANKKTKQGDTHNEEMHKKNKKE